MNLKKFMSKHFVLRFLLLLALVGGAAFYDLCHTSDQKLALQNNKKTTSQETENTKTFFCNQVPVFNLKTSPTEANIKFRFACTEDKFLLQHYNLRTFQMMKEEAIQASFISTNLIHSLPFNKVLYSSPDDVPPLV